MADLIANTMTGETTTLDEGQITDLRSRLRGALLTSEDEGYDQARRVWNGNIDRHPSLVARCSGTADVIESVLFARRHNLLVAVRGGAHNAAGHGTCEGGLVIDLSPMKGIRVDPAQRTARAQGGVLWSEFDRETQAFGLATTGGTVSNTGIAGLTLGGGFGYLSGQFGMTCDNLLSADVVTADGQFLQASAEENPDLFWALRGGGGNFGIVTSFEFRVHPVGPIVLGGMVLHPMAAAKDVLRFIAEFGDRLPDEAFVLAALLTSPDGAPVVAMVLSHNGPIEDGERVLQPARTFGSPLADLVQPMPYVVRQSLLDEGVAQHGVQRYWKSGFASHLSEEIIDVLIDSAAAFPTPMSVILTYPLHGAVTRVAPDATAYGVRDLVWDVNAVAQWTDPADTERSISWTRNTWEQIEPFGTGTAYINHMGGDDWQKRIRATYGANYDRLVEVKRKYDPDNFFRLNANISPAR